MTRFWISLEEGVQLVLKALTEARGGETFISKIPSFHVKDLAEAMQEGVATKEVGIRPGEKLHEIMVTTEDAPYTYEYDRHFIVYPQIAFHEDTVIHPGGEKVPDGFSYASDNNKEWLDVAGLKELLKKM